VPVTPGLVIVRRAIVFVSDTAPVGALPPVVNPVTVLAPVSVIVDTACAVKVVPDIAPLLMDPADVKSTVVILVIVPLCAMFPLVAVVKLTTKKISTMQPNNYGNTGN
jgi:hypothetical protein